MSQPPEVWKVAGRGAEPFPRQFPKRRIGAGRFEDDPRVILSKPQTSRIPAIRQFGAPWPKERRRGMAQRAPQCVRHIITTECL
jgi:hypothetical protein